MEAYFGDNSYYKLSRHEGHFYVHIRAIYAGGDARGGEIPFVLDTGAYMTVISRSRAERYGYDRLPKTTTAIKGYTGAEPADFVCIPGLKILDYLFTDVPVLIPHSAELEQNIIGLNVLEYFNYYIETENDRLYLSLNPNPRPYDKLLACGKVFAVTPDD